MIPFFCEKMKQHEETIDPASPRDYLDYLILDAQENDEIGYIAIAWTLVVLYVAGSDTLATTLRWLFLNLTAFPNIQGDDQIRVISVTIYFKINVPKSWIIAFQKIANSSWTNVHTSMPFCSRTLDFDLSPMRYLIYAFKILILMESLSRKDPVY